MKARPPSIRSAVQGPHHSPAQPQWEGGELAVAGSILTSKMVLSSERHSGTLWGAGDGPTQRTVCATEKSEKAQQDVGPSPLRYWDHSNAALPPPRGHSLKPPINPIMIHQRKCYTPATDSRCETTDKTHTAMRLIDEGRETDRETSKKRMGG